MNGQDVSALVESAERIAAEVAAAYADAVDRDARFPSEAIEALKEARLLSAWLPVDDGGGGATIRDIARIVQILGKACASTSMVYAMHQSQIACLLFHADTPALREERRRVATEELLLASATTEIGIGGDVRRSTCAVEQDAAGNFELVKNAPVISYADDSDIIFVTARRSPDAAATDQVLVVCEKGDLTLQQTSEWNTVGLRGTCSPGYILTARSTVDHIIPRPYADISASTMLPVAHILWSAVWLGIAEGATAKARQFVRTAARRSPGKTPPGALRLAELDVELAAFAGRVDSAARRFDREGGAGIEPGMAWAVDYNVLKVYSSRAVVDIVTKALLICGIQGYQLDSPMSLGRHLRDAHGAALMVNNDRILENTASMELVYRGE